MCGCRGARRGYEPPQWGDAMQKGLGKLQVRECNSGRIGGQAKQRASTARVVGYWSSADQGDIADYNQTSVYTVTLL